MLHMKRRRQFVCEKGGQPTKIANLNLAKITNSKARQGKQMGWHEDNHVLVIVRHGGQKHHIAG